MKRTHSLVLMAGMSCVLLTASCANDGTDDVRSATDDLAESATAAPPPPPPTGAPRDLPATEGPGTEVVDAAVFDISTTAALVVVVVRNTTDSPKNLELSYDYIDAGSPGVNSSSGEGVDFVLPGMIVPVVGLVETEDPAGLAEVTNIVVQSLEPVPAEDNRDITLIEARPEASGELVLRDSAFETLDAVREEFRRVGLSAACYTGGMLVGGTAGDILQDDLESDGSLRGRVFPDGIQPDRCDIALTFGYNALD